MELPILSVHVIRSKGDLMIEIGNVVIGLPVTFSSHSSGITDRKKEVIPMQ